MTDVGRELSDTRMVVQDHESALAGRVVGGRCEDARSTDAAGRERETPRDVVTCTCRRARARWGEA
ncbi:hypothetical protein GCM10018779_66070 [Streptomyces griseocarneus]|nr:hypothetical protein GCM10018779_66070 [Streptomyces griseocarneus]